MSDYDICDVCGEEYEECGSCDAMLCACDRDDPRAHSDDCTIHYEEEEEED